MPQAQSAAPAAASAATLAANYDWYENAAGSEYAIATAADLLGFANIVNGTDGRTADSFAGKTVKLSASIDLSGISWTPVGINGKVFSGTFDGCGETISNVAVVLNSFYSGLFGHIKSSGSDTAVSIKNLVIDGASIDYASYGGVCAGALAGIAEGAFIEGVSAKNVVIAATGMTGYVEFGGLVGESRYVMVAGCSVDGLRTIYDGNGQAYLGGLTSFVLGKDDSWTVAGAKGNSLFTNCSVSNATITSTQNGTVSSRVGGFAVGGSSYTGTTNGYDSCWTRNVNIVCHGEGQHIAGGFLAFNMGLNGEIGCSGCSAGGTITHDGSDASSVFGGFVGWQGGRGRTYSNCSASVGIVANGTVGGFVGKTVQYLQENDHTNQYAFEGCVANGDVKGNTAGGFAGEVGCYDGDKNSHQIWVDFTNCIANGDVAGGKAAGFLGAIVNENAQFTNPERSGVTLTKCTANGSVLGDDIAAGMIAQVANKNAYNGISTPVRLVGCVSSPVIAGTSESTVTSTGCVFAEDAFVDRSAISIDVTQGGVVPSEEEKPLPPADTDGTDDGTDNGSSDVKPVSKSDGGSSKPLAKTGDSAGLALAGLGAAAVAASGACAIARRRG